MKKLRLLLRSSSGMTLLEAVVSVLIIAMVSLMVFMVLITGGNLIRRGERVDSLGMEAAAQAEEAKSGTGERYSVSFNIDGMNIPEAVIGEVIEARLESGGDAVSFRIFRPYEAPP